MNSRIRSNAQTRLPLFADGDDSKNLHVGPANNNANRLSEEDRPFHAWYRFVLSFPPHLVANYIDEFGLERRHLLLDPFCGTGTTLVEAKLRDVPAIGLEANPFPCFASSVKTDWSIESDELEVWAHRVAAEALGILQSQGIDDCAFSDGTPGELPLQTLDAETTKLLITDSISPMPLHKTLVLLARLKEHRTGCFYRNGLLALGNALASSIGNLRFGPEVGVGKIKKDVPVVASWLAEVDKMCRDLRQLPVRDYPVVKLYQSDARVVSQVLAPSSVDGVITSPPYPNEKDYTRTTRLESAVLGFVNSRSQLKSLKRQLLRSNTRGVYKGDEDDAWVRANAAVQTISEEIEKRRIELGKTSGFERLYGKVTRLYFGGMARHLSDLRTVLRPGARLAYVVGDQASYLKVMIHTGSILADIARVLGYEFIRADPFRTRFATATKEQLREEVVVLRWPG